MIHIAAHTGHGHISLVVAGHEHQMEGGRVCAAVSAITQTAVLGLAEVARQYPHLVQITVTDEEHNP